MTKILILVEVAPESADDEHDTGLNDVAYLALYTRDQMPGRVADVKRVGGDPDDIGDVNVAEFAS